MVQQVEQGSVGAIHGLQGPFGPGPLVGGEVGDGQIGVLQPGVGDQPQVHHEVGQAVDAEHPHQGELQRQPPQHQQAGQQAQVGAHHLAAERPREQRAHALVGGGAVPEMGGGPPVLLPARGTHEQIEGPAQHQVAEQRHPAEQPAAQAPAQVFGDLPGDRLLPGGDVGFPLLQVIAVGVVGGVAAGPAEVGHQQHAVQHEANPAFEPPVGVEGVVPAFMGQHPQPHHHRAGDGAIEQPQRCGPQLQGDLGAHAVGQHRQPQGHPQASPGLHGVEPRQLSW